MEVKTKTTNFLDRMIYDKGTHRFSLYAEEIQKYIPELNHYNGELDLQEELDKQSEVLYNWIYSMIPSSNIDYVEYVLAKDERCLSHIYEALHEILLSDLYSNSMASRFNLGVNPKGSIIDKEVIRDSIITEEAKKRIENIPGNLLTSRSFNIRLPEDRYERWDY